MSGRGTVAVALIVLGGLALRLAVLSGLVLYDDTYYLLRAVELSLGQAGVPANYFEARIGLVGPPALLYRVFGVGPITTTAFQVVSSLGSIVAAFVFGRRLFDVRTGLLAAVLVAVLPLDVIFAGVLWGTTPVTFFVGLSLGCFLLGERSGRLTTYLASGVALGLAAVVHETAILVLVFYPAYALCIARPARRQVLFLVGLLCALAIDPLIHGYLGDPWARFDLLRASSFVQGTGTSTAFPGVSATWLAEPFLRMLTEQELGLFPWFIVPIVLARLWRPRSEAEAALALFVCVVSLWVLFGTISPTTYRPLERLPRYLSPVALPALLLLAHELARMRRPLSQVVLLTVLVVSSLVCILVDGGRARMEPYREARQVLAQTQARTVLVEASASTGLLFVEGFAPQYKLVVVEPGVVPSPPGSPFVVGSPAEMERVGAMPGVQVLARVAKPDTLYAKLLRHPMMARLLRLTRPPERVDDLQNKLAGPALVVYRIP